MKLWDVKSEENFANLLQISAANFATFKLSLCLFSSLLTLQELFRHVWQMMKVGAFPPLSLDQLKANEYNPPCHDS